VAGRYGRRGLRTGSSAGARGASAVYGITATKREATENKIGSPTPNPPAAPAVAYSNRDAVRECHEPGAATRLPESARATALRWQFFTGIVAVASTPTNSGYSPASASVNIDVLPFGPMSVGFQ